MTSSNRSRSTAARVATVVAAGLVVLAASHQDGPLPSLAVLQDSQTTVAQTVTSGNIALSLADGAAAGQWTGAFSLVPGATSTYYRLTVTNTGSAPLVYSVTATSTSNTLSSQMTLSIAELATATATCNASGYSAGTVVSNTGPLAFGTTTGLDVVGSSSTGSGLSLTADAVDNLCMKVDLPLGTGLGYAGRGRTATTTFSFSAESA